MWEKNMKEKEEKDELWHTRGKEVIESKHPVNEFCIQ